MTHDTTPAPIGADALRHALEIAEAALADIGDADREPGDDVAWCEARAAEALPTVRAALASARVMSPRLFAHGLAPLPKDGLHTAARMRWEVEQVRRMLEAALDAAPVPAPRNDAELLDWLRDNSCDLRCIDVPTGADDSDIDWVVVEHYMAKPCEREIGRAYKDDPRAAIRAARAAKEGGADVETRTPAPR